MPLGANVVDVADQALADLVDRVVVQNAVMPLMADGEDDRIAAASCVAAATRAISLHWATLWRHQLFGEHVLALAHRGDGRLVMQVQAAGR